VGGSSAYMSPGAVTYGGKQAAVLLGADLSEPRPETKAEYIESKKRWTAAVSRRMRQEVGAVWTVCEAGACGPTFNVRDEMTAGFSVVFVCGPVEFGAVLHSDHARREDNMWAFTSAALDFIAKSIAEASASSVSQCPAAAPLLTITYDRYGGAEMEVPETAAGACTGRFDQELKTAVDQAMADEKRGLWLKVPVACAGFLGSATARGFKFHHAQPQYVLLTRWLPTNVPSTLPPYAFTQVGVGGVVVNAYNEVLLVQERVSPLPIYQGSWKLPGGLADPGEDFATTVRREVLEETGVSCHLEGIVSMRHMHNVRFGQADLYVVVKLKTDGDDKRPVITMDPNELQGARWMDRETIVSLVVAKDYKEPLNELISFSNWQMIEQALDGPLIEGRMLGGLRPAMFYTAPRQASNL